MAIIVGMVAAAVNLDFEPRRGKARLRAGIAAELVSVNGRQKVSLVDLSQTGARLRVHDSEPLGRGVLKWMDFEAFGSVVRREGKDIGLQFEYPIDLAWVLDTKEWLSVRPRGKDEVREFARDWVHGHAAATARRTIFGTRGRASAILSEIVVPSQGPRQPNRTAIEWCRAGMPFAFGGVLLGMIAGFWSIYY